MKWEDSIIIIIIIISIIIVIIIIISCHLYTGYVQLGYIPGTNRI
jgi:hypothetical protein